MVGALLPKPPIQEFIMGIRPRLVGKVDSCFEQFVHYISLYQRRGDQTSSTEESGSVSNRWVRRRERLHRRLQYMDDMSVW